MNNEYLSAIPEGGKDLIGYNVEYWVDTPKKRFLAKGIVVGFKVKKHGRNNTLIGIYKIKVGDKNYNRRRSQFTVTSKIQTK